MHAAMRSKPNDLRTAGAKLFGDYYSTGEKYRRESLEADELWPMIPGRND
jgi:hypothetical protein